MPDSIERNGWRFLGVGITTLFLGMACFTSPETASAGCGLVTFGGLLAIVGVVQLI